MFRLLNIVLAQILLGSHRLHCTLFQWEDRRNVNEGVRDKAALFRLMRLEQEEFRRLYSFKAACHARTARKQTRTLRQSIGDRVIWIKRIFLGMSNNHVGSQFADEIG